MRGDVNVRSESESDAPSVRIVSVRTLSSSKSSEYPMLAVRVRDVWMTSGLGDLDPPTSRTSVRLSRTRDLLDLGVKGRGDGERMERNGVVGLLGVSLSYGSVLTSSASSSLSAGPRRSSTDCRPNDDSISDASFTDALEDFAVAFVDADELGLTSALGFPDGGFRGVGSSSRTASCKDSTSITFTASMK